MHNSSILRMKWFINNYVNKINKEKITILDVGCIDKNNSYKNLFSNKKFKYIGLDMENGDNVDIVLKNPYDWKEIKTDYYDLIISGQAFEHIEFFWKILENMVRVLKKDGLLCIIVPNGFSEHRYPVDCYRFFSDGMVSLARYTNLEILHFHTNSAPLPLNKNIKWYSKFNADSMLIAKKNYNGKTKILNYNKYQCIPINHKEFNNNMINYNQLKNRIKLYIILKDLYIIINQKIRNKLYLIIKKYI